ncbi:hypothetical protein BJ912DRAFT_1146717 [Pholiota molesta]|nr:hypothetical protein BJ912DRAFT_1146717 [Pholiota molesta]
METAFFADTSPWCDLDSEFQQYLCTSNLVDRLSSVLSDLISQRLPPIQVELERSIRATRTLLARLPRPPSADPRSEIITLLHAFTSDLSRHVEGVPDDKSSTFGKGIGLIQAIRPAQERFKMMIRATEPNFKPFKRSEAGKKRLGPATFLENEESDEEASDVDIDGEGVQTQKGDKEMGDNREECNDDDGDRTGKDEDEEMKLKTTRSSAKNGEPLDDAIYIDDVLKIANRARTRQLPGSYPYAVQKTFITKIVEEWKDPSDTLCETAHATVLEQIKSLVRKHFSQFGQGSLERKIRSIMEHHLKHCQELAKERVTWHLVNEEMPFTLNTHYLADYKDKFLAYYKAARDQDYCADLKNAIQSMKISPMSAKKAKVEATGITKILSGFAEIGMSVKPEDLGKLLPPDPMEPALVIMAEVRAYFRVAYKRIADNVPTAIDRELVRGAAKDTLQILYENLGIDGVDGERPRVHVRNALWNVACLEATTHGNASSRFASSQIDGQPLGQARNEQFGDIIYDKREIEDRIRRAQFAILSPKTSAKKFLAGDANKRPAQLSFSLNAVTLQISGPDVADLSFCDLPADPRSEIATLLHTFTADLSRHVEGVQDDRSSTFGEGIGLIQAIRPTQERFRMMIRAAEPNFQPFVRSAGKTLLGPATFLWNEEGDKDKDQAQEDDKEIEQSEEEEEDDSDSDSDSDVDDDGDDDGSDDDEDENEEEEAEGKKKTLQQKESSRSRPVAETRVIGKKRKEPPSDAIYIDEVLERANQARTRELPGSFPFAVLKTFINNITKEWADPAYMLCQTAHATGANKKPCSQALF